MYPKRFTLALRSAVNGGATATSVQYDLTSLSSRLTPGKQYRLTIRNFAFSASVWTTSNSTISVDIPEFARQGILVSASTTNTLTALQSTFPMILIHNDNGNSNRLLAFDDGSENGVDGYFTSNIITVRILDEATKAAPVLTADVNYTMIMSIDELE